MPTPGSAAKKDSFRSQLDGNDYRTSLIKVVGAGMVALISLAQLALTGRFGSGGPRYLLPASDSAVVAAAIFLGLAYGNFSYTTAQLKARLDKAIDPAQPETKWTETSEVPSDVANTVKAAGTQMDIGVVIAILAVSAFLSSIWWPAN